MAASADKRTQAHKIATFNYMKWNDLYKTEKPFQIVIDIPKDAPDQRTTNIEFEAGPEETITDIRGSVDSYNLDRHGFAYFPMDVRLPARRFSDPGLVNEKYIPECVSLIKRVIPDVDRVRIFGWRLRSSGDPSASTVMGKMMFKPASSPHVGKCLAHLCGCHHLRLHVCSDQTPGAVHDMVSDYFPDEAAKLFRGRVRTVM